MKYQAFISYKHSAASRPKVTAVENALKKYAKPWWKPHIKLFRDEKEMPTATDLVASINNALENSDYLIYFASWEAAQSEWVQKELLKWCRDLNRSDKLIIILIADNLVTDTQKETIAWEQTDALPSCLKEYIPIIPTYEDLRWSTRDNELTLENIPFRDSINRITARFRGKTPAEMDDENMKIDRSNKRLKNVTIGVLAVLLAIAVITTWIAVVQKNRADKQYEEAVKQKKNAYLNEQNAIKEKKRADEQYKEAVNQKNRADEQYRIAVSNRLASEAEIIMPKDISRAIRIAEAAYKIGFPSPTAAVVRGLCSAVFSTLERPCYTISLQHENSVRAAVFSPDGSKILTASYDNSAKLWDIKGNLLTQLKGHTSDVTSAVFSPDGSRILTASKDNTAKLWDINGNLLTELKGHTNDLFSAVFSPDGSRILTTSMDNTAKLWDIKGKILAELIHTPDAPTSAVLSPDNSRILTTCESIKTPPGDRTPKLWDIKGNLLVELKGHIDTVNSAVFSPDGSRILTTSDDRTAKLWDIKGNMLADFKGHTDSLFNAVFSPDGSRILTSSADNTAKLWDLKGNLLADLKRHTDKVTSALFSPDGKFIVTASSDNTAIIWPTPETILEWLRTDPIPKLTAEDIKELGIEGFNID